MAPCFVIILLTGLIIKNVIASPADSPHYNSFQKRAIPMISNEFKGGERRQVKDAVSDAIQLAQNAILPLMPGPRQDTTVFEKYFTLGDLNVVRAVFNNILNGSPCRGGGRRPYSPDGAPLLREIRIRKDYRRGQSDQYACLGPHYAAVMRDGSSNHPQLVICERGLLRGGLAKGYRNGPPAVDCSTIGPQVSIKMKVLGAVVLHEYLHFQKLVRPPLSHRTSDFAYGPFNCQQLRHSQRSYLALLNPDSYVWYALETTWRRRCQRDFLPPTPPQSPTPDSSPDSPPNAPPNAQNAL